MGFGRPAVPLGRCEQHGSPHLPGSSIMGIPVVIASNGRGICVRNVTSGAPVMTVATNGFGIPIVLGTKGIPFVVQGGGTPTPTPAPSFSVQPSITGTPQVGVSFVGTPGTASNTTSHTYRWLLATTSGGTYAAISGATSASYTPVSGDETKYLKFEDTATGPGGSTVATTTFAGPVAAVGITAPVITQTSTAGANPFLWTTAENATFYEGFYWNIVTATGASTGAASTNLLAGTTTANVIQQIDAADLSGTDPITFTGLTTTSVAGPFALRERVGSEDGLGGYNWGAWSNVLTDTLAGGGGGGGATFSTTNKTSFGALSNANLTWSYDGAAGSGSMCAAGSSTKTTGKWEIALVIDYRGATGFSNPVNIGFCLGSEDLTPPFPAPGYTNSHGLCFKAYPAATSIYQAAAYTGTDYGSMASSADVRLIVDIDAKLVWVKINGTAQAGNPAAGTGGIDASGWMTGAITFYAGPEDNRSVTLVPSPSGVTSGFTSWI